MKHLAFALGLAALVAVPASAQDYPSRPIRVIVTTSPGGISDVFVRALSEPLHKRLGQPVVVENRAGGFMIHRRARLRGSQPRRLHALCHAGRAADLQPVHPEEPALRSGEEL